MASKDDLDRAVAKHRAWMNAQLALKQAWERIDFRFDVVKPSIKQLEEDAAQGELPDFRSELERE